MYHVTTSNLGPDGRRVRTGPDKIDRGEMDAKQLIELLDAFVDIDPAENEEHDPHIAISGRSAKLNVRTSRGRLQVYDVRDHAAPAVEMSPDAIIQRLDKAETTAPFPGQLPEEGGQPSPTAPHKGIAFAMLALGLILNGYILYSVFYVESVNKKVDVKLLTDPEEIHSKEVALAGTYATGQKTDDRVIEVDVSGSVRFYEIGSKGPINDTKDTYKLGRHDGMLCMTTTESGVVDMVGDTLVYYRDVYQRRRGPAP
ncbi:MAG TPA: hypothetical protein VGG34_14835 [Opitutaceae bacterium]|jgi:hypothetical protein